MTIKRIEPGPGQESVWDYPRPPRLEDCSETIKVVVDGVAIAESNQTKRVLETSHPPVYYIPPEDVRSDLLRDAPGGSRCEWKGAARYWSVELEGEFLRQVAWSYDYPFPAYVEIAGYLSFYPDAVECYVDGERVQPQPGGFYGGWITSELVGPFKGEPGTQGW